ncbi:flippase [Candidatus Pacearchaeota archaeon]|nr:flippase [Candidatus Pacearchaeota archaeon]
MKNQIKEEAQDIGNALRRIRTRNFSGTAGQVVKNSTYQLATNLTFKFGSMAFTIILARMLGVELFGLYTLALSTIVLFSAFSSFGIGSTLITFVSKSLLKNNPQKAKSYVKGLLKYKLYLTTTCSLFLIFCAYFLANNYYQKPIFYALLAGALYIPASSLVSFLATIFQSDNNFKTPMIEEIIFQILRLTIIPIGILFLLKTSASNATIITIIILITALCHFVGLVYLKIATKKEINFLKGSAEPLTKNEVKDVKKFIFPLVLTSLSGMFYGYIDTIMLGHYIPDASYIGLYGVALGLIGSAGALISFLPSVILPTFSRMKGESLEHIFSKVRKFTLLIGVSAAIFTYLIAKYILMLYGPDFAQATIILQILSIMLILAPVAGVYDAYFTSIKKTELIAKLLIISTIVNVILNIVLIKYGLQFGMMQAVLGACLASIFSRAVYLGGFLIAKKSIG